MYPEVVPLDGNIELIENSGIQFIDYDLTVDWKEKNAQSVARSLETGYFCRVTGGQQQEPLVRLIPQITDQVKYINPFTTKEVDTQDAFITVSTRQSLDLYNGVWFPIPFLPEHSIESLPGPINWVRARIIQVDNEQDETPNSLVNADVTPTTQELIQQAQELQNPDLAHMQRQKERSNVCHYRIVLAFDTKSQNAEEFFGYFAPTKRDVESGVRFKMAHSAAQCHFFLKSINNGLPWVNEWAESVFRDLYKERIQPKILDDELEDAIRTEHLHEAHYLNLLAFIALLVKPNPVHFIANSIHTNQMMGVASNKYVDVSLILDIGNSRTCGILVEDHPNVTRSDDNFSDTYVLTLRDLNTPEHVYNKPFSSQIEFARPNFDYNNCSARSGRPDAFSWPSLVRVGNEAVNLAAHRQGNEGFSGIVSPKRYLWNTEPLVNERWVFNNYSYQIKSKKLATQQKDLSQRAFLNSVSCFFNSEGKAYFALDADETKYDNLESCYSNRSTMTFLIIELLLQAMSQMNSVWQRQQCTSKDTPRRLRAIILTTPPSMPAEEKELYRACVYEAIGILWKALDFDHSSPREFPKADSCYPPIPSVYLDWNEAEAGQVVYIYNESQKVFKGNCKRFVESLRRPGINQRLAESLVDHEGKALINTRIASIDIGGGTSDLVIKDYSFKRDENHYASDIVPHEILKDGFKLAGDDIVHDIIKECFMTRLAITFAKYRIDFKPILQQLVGDSGAGNIQNEVMRSKFTQQILVKLAYKVLFHLEHLKPNTPHCVVKGSIRQFLEDLEVNETLEPTVKRMGSMELPSPEVVNFANNIMRQYLPNFSILDFKISLDIASIHRAFVKGEKFNICRILNKLSEVVNVFDVDLLILTGRASKLPCVKEFFLQRIAIPAVRIMPMHSYRCDSWYPFKHSGEFIGDPKTTASVGALLCYLRLSHNKFPNFRFYSYPEDVKNNAHYVGIIDNSNMISDDAVLYKYESAQMLAHKNASDEDDEESNFIPYKRTNEAFATQLSVEIGSRLLDDHTFEATPLYKIEAYNSVDDIKQVRRALSLTYGELNREEVMQFIDKLDFEIQDKFKLQAEALLSAIENSSSNYTSYQEQLVNELKNTVIAQIDTEFIPKEAKGLFANKKKIQEENEQAKQALMAQRYNDLYASEVTAKYEAYVQQQGLELTAKLSELLNSAIVENISVLRQRYSKGYEVLLRKLNVERGQFNVTLKVVNKHSPYPLKFIKESQKNLKNVETFELERVEYSDGKDYTPFFRMYLKTISGAKVKYFMDSGTIDLNGLNPRNMI